MTIDKITMKDGTYFRLGVDNVNAEWWQKIANIGEFESKTAMFKAGYKGLPEIEGYFQNNIVTEVKLVYYFDEYDEIPVELAESDVATIQEFVIRHWDEVSDNHELQLGDAEWCEQAYLKKHI